MIESPLTWSGWLDEIGRRIGRPFTPLMCEQLTTYIELLRTWNAQINLTAILDDEGIAIRHLLDSLVLLPTIESLEQSGLKRPLRLIDIGTGAGFPGIPLKIVRPEWQVTLLDSLAKRLRFLDVVIQNLNLADIQTWHDRAEDGARRRTLRENYDIAVARAVAALPVLCEYCLPYVRIGGLFIAMKGSLEQEWPAAEQAVRQLGGKLENILEFPLPGTDFQRSLVIIRKVRPTPPIYPRKAGKPEKQPL